MLVKVNQLPDLKNESVILDTETTGLNQMVDKPFMVAIEVGSKIYSVQWRPEVAAYLQDQLPTAKEIIGHNIKFDMHMAIQGGMKDTIPGRCKLVDTAVNASLINEWEERYDLGSLGTKYVGMGKSSGILWAWLASIFGGPASKVQMCNLSKAPIEGVVSYCEDDIKVTRALHDWQRKELIKQELSDIFKIECNAISTLLDMERHGVKVDLEALNKTKERFQITYAQNVADIVKLVGHEVNTLSAPQMVEAFMKLGLELPKVRGKLSFARDQLELISHPFAQLVIVNRMIRKMQNTFVEGLVPHILNGRVHTNFNQVRGDDYGTGTGRLSSNDPNMQQTPKRNKEAASIVRSLFIPEEGQVWLAPDWSQFEFRIFAHYSRDENIIDAYHKNPKMDYHQACADLTGVARNPYAKQINLGLVFGMGEGKLAKILGLPYTIIQKYNKDVLLPGKEAKDIFTKYHTAIPNVKSFLSQAQNVARTRGYVKTLLGRHLRFPGGTFTHKAGGLVFQGTAADFMKQKLPLINSAVKEFGAKLLLVIHDEYDISGPDDPKLKAAVKEIMEDIPQLRVPIVANVGVGPNWWEASKG